MVQREATQFLIRKPGHHLPVGQVLRIKLSVKYDTAESTPKLIGVQLNAKAICPGEAPKPITPPPLAKGLVSPCPSIFSYQSLDKDAGKWFGLILLNSKTVITDVTITILLDRPSLQLGVSSMINKCKLSYRRGEYINKITRIISCEVCFWN